MEKVNCGLTSIQLELNLSCLELWDIGACAAQDVSCISFEREKSEAPGENPWKYGENIQTIERP